MGRITGVEFLAGALVGFFCILYHVKTGSESQSAFYPIGIRG